MARPYDLAYFWPEWRSSTTATYSCRRRKCARAEGVSFGRGGPRQRDLGGTEHVRRIKELLFFMRNGTRPGSATDHDFASYRLVVERL